MGHRTKSKEQRAESNKVKQINDKRIIK